MKDNKQEVQELLSGSSEAIRQKKAENARMIQMFDGCAKATGISKDVLRKCKDYVHYRGAGMETTLEVDKQSGVKFKDRVAPTFRKLRDIIVNCTQTEYDELLQEYIDALKPFGITIIVNKKMHRHFLPDDIRMIHNTVEGASEVQSIICGLANKVRDDDAVVADTDLEFVKKSDYKKVAEFYTKRQDGTDVEGEYDRENIRATRYKDAMDAIFYNQFRSNSQKR